MQLDWRDDLKKIVALDEIAADCYYEGADLPIFGVNQFTISLNTKQ